MFHKMMRGVTLLEVLLVLAIGASLVMLSLRMYANYRITQAAETVKLNIDSYFQALDMFYQIQCRLPSNASTSGQLGLLDPRHVPAPDLQNPFAATSYITSYLPRTPLYSVLGNTYIAQLNPGRMTREVGVFYPPNTGPDQNQTIFIKKSNSVYYWVAQVAIVIDDSSNINAYKPLLGADCVSHVTGNTVTPCSASDGAGTALVFQRMPSLNSPAMQSSFWITMPRMKQFVQQYTNDDNYALQKDDSTWNTSSGYENYLCGN